MSKKRKISEESESEPVDDYEEDETLKEEESEENYIKLISGDDTKPHVNAFFESNPDEKTKEWIKAEAWKTCTFFIHVEDARDSQTEDDVIHGAVPGSALTLDQYKILYAVQCDLQFLYMDENDNCEMVLENQIQTWFFNPKLHGLKNQKKYWPQFRNITWRDDDSSACSLFQYKHEKLHPTQTAIPIHIIISD